MKNRHSAAIAACFSTDTSLANSISFGARGSGQSGPADMHKSNDIAGAGSGLGLGTSVVAG